LSSDHKIPHKRLRDFFPEEFECDKEVKSEPILSHKYFVTPTSQIPTSSSKVNIPSTSIKGYKPSSFEAYDNTPVIEKLQQGNA
jgi:hypothetical protein